jgi:hypothetical protein
MNGRFSLRLSPRFREILSLRFTLTGQAE